MARGVRDTASDKGRTAVVAAAAARVRGGSGHVDGDNGEVVLGLVLLGPALADHRLPPTPHHFHTSAHPPTTHHPPFTTHLAIPAPSSRHAPRPRRRARGQWLHEEVQTRPDFDHF